jgi:putative ABC transport system permease protein
MGRKALGAAYGLDGAFNDVSLGLLRGADPEAAIDRLDLLLERYGGTGAVTRADQISNWFLMSEFQQLKTVATLLPGIFLAIAAFLTNTVLARLIATERREISLMKAFGYSNLAVGLHYAKMALAMAVVGIALGAAVGAGLGRYETALYSEFYRFPFLSYRPSGVEFVLGAAVSLAAALFGAIWAVRHAVALPPAEAMRPPRPDRIGAGRALDMLSRRLDNPTRIVLRQIARAPLRAAMSVAGVAMSVGLLVMALQWWDSIERVAQSHFAGTLRQDVTVGFFEARPMAARFELARLPGVLYVEPVRIEPANLVAGLRRHRGAVTALPIDARLQVIDDVRGWVLPVPRGGLVLATMLADKLGVSVGDQVTVEILQGARPTLQMTVTGLHETDIAMPAYMALAELNRKLREPAGFQYANLLVDALHADDLYAALKEIPDVSSVLVKQAALDKFQDTLGDTILIFISFFAGFACALAVGVIYNAVRVALSERGRELATLRVLGFTRWEISYILLGEAALLVLAALPLGCLAGIGLIWIMSQGFQTELYRVPPVLYAATFAKAVMVILGASVLAAALVRRHLDRLDLIAVLKTRE